MIKTLPIKRAYGDAPGIYQRCTTKCPDPCHTHTWTWQLQVTVDHKRVQMGRAGYASAEEARIARATALQEHATTRGRVVRGQRARPHLRQVSTHVEWAVPHKRCPACGITRGQEEFDRSASRPSGLADYCKECRSIHRRDRHTRTRYRALMLLGGVCRCCGQSRQVFLQIDHINGDGAAHRRELSGARTMSTAHICRWVVANPDEARRRCQVLCANCNIAKETEENHTCP